jgi:hypothetical protein
MFKKFLHIQELTSILTILGCVLEDDKNSCSFHHCLILIQRQKYCLQAVIMCFSSIFLFLFVDWLKYRWLKMDL